MRYHLSLLRTLRQALFRVTNISAAVALAVVVITGILVDRQNVRVFEQHLRADTVARLNLVRMKLESNVRDDIQLGKALASTIAAEPDITEKRFAALASEMTAQNASLRLLAAAPDLKVSMIYPHAGNEKALGLDYRKNPDLYAAVVRARDKDEVVLVGPQSLVQGGEGLIARFPVFTTGPEDARRFWGVVTAVINTDRLLAASGLSDETLPIDVLIVGRDGLGTLGAPFHGRETIRGESPVGVNVALPNGSWQIFAVPKGGWNQTPDNVLTVRALIVIAGLVVMVPILVAGYLVEERGRHLAALRSREAELRRLTRRLGIALDASEIGVWECDVVSGSFVWDERTNEIHGFPPEGSRTYADWLGTLHPEDRRRAEEEFRVAIKSTGRFDSEHRLVLADGEIRHVRTVGTLHEEDEAFPCMIGVNWDVSADAALNNDLKRANRLSEARNGELEAAKNRIEHNALHDSLTGLPNRRYLDDVLSGRAPDRAGFGERLAILHVDLDRFKQINDTLGHAAGDAMLVHASAVLRSATRSGDFVARIGGDEFVVLCASAPPPDQLAALAGRIVEVMRQPVPFDEHLCRFGVSIGIAVTENPDADLRRLMVDADIALYRAKKRGRSRFEFFTDAMQSELVRGKRLGDEILSGLERGEFAAFYQPQFNGRTFELVGVEALARWRHPSEGVLASDGFADVAQDINALSAIDRVVLRSMAADLRVWDAAGLAVPRVSIDVSLRRLGEDGLIAELRKLGIEPRRFAFELVEPATPDESSATVARNIKRIKAMGIGVDIDEFGTGTASILSLLKLKPQRLKIDRQLVAPLVSSPAQRPLVRSLVDIGRSLGIEVAAEGVDTMEHAQILRDLGCDVVQGEAFAAPLPAEGFAALLRERRWRAAS